MLTFIKRLKIRNLSETSFFLTFPAKQVPSTQSSDQPFSCYVSSFKVTTRGSELEQSLASSPTPWTSPSNSHAPYSSETFPGVRTSTHQSFIEIGWKVKQRIKDKEESTKNAIINKLYFYEDLWSLWPLKNPFLIYNFLKPHFLANLKFTENTM